jgi:hypothetical protein
VSYSVEVTVTSLHTTYVETVESGDPGDYGLADPLTVKQSLPSGDDHLPLAHPDPEEATITLIAPGSSTYADMAQGDPVAVKVWNAPGMVGTPTVEFYGRIATLTAQPHERGILYTLACVDYTADLGAMPVHLDDWPVETIVERLARIETEAAPGVNLLQRDAEIVVTITDDLAAAGSSETDALSAILAVLNSWDVRNIKDENGNTIPSTVGELWNNGLAQLRVTLRPNIVDGLLGTDPVFWLSRRPTVPFKRIDYTPPARLTLSGGVYSVTVDPADSDPDTGAPILDAAYVRFAPVYTQSKSGNGVANVYVGTNADGSVRLVTDWRTALDNRIGFTVPWWFSQPTLTPVVGQGPQVQANLETQLDPALDDVSVAGIISQFRVPFRPNMRLKWSIGTMQWQLWADPTPWRRPQLLELLTVGDVEAGRLPTNREWVVGLVAATTLTIAGGRPLMDIDIIPNTLDHNANAAALGDTDGVVRMDSPAVAGVRLDQTNPRDTLDDYRIVRGS